MLVSVWSPWFGPSFSKIDAFGHWRSHSSTYYIYQWRIMKLKYLKMAATSGVDISKLSDVFPLTWSVDTKHDVFQRWSQGKLVQAYI